jgi:transcriptional regulator with XRE-family HTH domain
MARLKLDLLLKETGISGNQLAEELGVSRNTVTNWMKGSDRGIFDHLVKLRNFFATKTGREIKIDDLLEE